MYLSGERRKGERKSELKLWSLMEITPCKEFASKEWCVVVNMGTNAVNLPDGTTLGHCCSGLFKNFPFSGECLIVFPVGDMMDDVPHEIAKSCRDKWTPVCNLYPKAFRRSDDFYRSPKVAVNGMELNLWYCGPNFCCGIHNEHSFFELHTQILGHGEMQMFREKDDQTIYSREILSPGQTHRPFYNYANHLYPWHCYKSRSSCLFLAIESPVPLTAPPNVVIPKQ